MKDQMMSFWISKKGKLLLFSLIVLVTCFALFGCSSELKEDDDPLVVPFSEGPQSPPSTNTPPGPPPT